MSFTSLLRKPLPSCQPRKAEWALGTQQSGGGGCVWWGEGGLNLGFAPNLCQRAGPHRSIDPWSLTPSLEEGEGRELNL